MLFSSNSCLPLMSGRQELLAANLHLSRASGSQKALRAPRRYAAGYKCAAPRPILEREALSNGAGPVASWNRRPCKDKDSRAHGLNAFTLQRRAPVERQKPAELGRNLKELERFALGRSAVVAVRNEKRHQLREDTSRQDFPLQGDRTAHDQLLTAYGAPHARCGFSSCQKKLVLDGTVSEQEGCWCDCKA